MTRGSGNLPPAEERHGCSFTGCGSSARVRAAGRLTITFPSTPFTATPEWATSPAPASGTTGRTAAADRSCGISLRWSPQRGSSAERLTERKPHDAPTETLRGLISSMKTLRFAACTCSPGRCLPPPTKRNHAPRRSSDCSGSALSNGIAAARVKTEAIDARPLAHLPRAGMLPEAYVAQSDLRHLRELLRHTRDARASAHVGQADTGVPLCRRLGCPRSAGAPARYRP